MKILVANIGSTSFKFRLFEMAGANERELAAGGADRIGQDAGTLSWQVVGQSLRSRPSDFADHGQAVTRVLEQLVADDALATPGDLDAVAFKAVMGGDLDPVVRVDEHVLERMEYFVPIAPMHNPAYIAAMRMFRQVLGETPLVAAFEPGFHHTIPLRRQRYAVPPEWAERYGIRRYGYHGASHCYIATRTAELMGADKARRIISCHLGGSSSVCAIRDGRSVANSFGLSAQSGLPHGARAGEFDPFALSLLNRQGGLSLDQMLTILGTQSGLAAVSGTSGDMRDIHEAAADGSERAKLAIDVLVTAIRDYLGAYLVELGGADAIVFTGGIGQKDPYVRAAVCDGLEFCSIELDERKNEPAAGECRIEGAKSSSAVWVMPTNEELIVARQAAELLAKGS
ncbi:MAG TPA: acetate/propionate family kinase [Phycisphaerae bacterium]|nr:acetate/propionate family kinase [Phycisphaerae bacterium]